MSPSALIGHTGFVGGNLAAQHSFDESYNSRNIDDIRGRRFGLLVVSGARAEKWKANADPESDLVAVRRLLDALATVEADRVALISTVDVFADPNGVDEDTPVSTVGLHAYGRHRRLIEETLGAQFDTTIVRLPGLYGTGLKKNVIYDFLNNNETQKIDSRGVFQFYGLDRIWRDVGTAIAAGLPVTHMATEPVAVAEVSRAAFGRTFVNEVLPKPARYDFRTKYDALFGGSGGYVESSADVLDGIRRYVERTAAIGRRAPA